MSWATCKAGSNNIHFNYPSIMNDGRNFASWQPGAVINENIRTHANINSNWEYRKYLTQNADNIIKLNQQDSCNNCACCGLYNSPRVSNTPYLYNNCLSRDQPYGYENSDLKQLYLTSEQLKIIQSKPINFARK
jgi:hypothetical protein